MNLPFDLYSYWFVLHVPRTCFVATVHGVTKSQTQLSDFLYFVASINFKYLEHKYYVDICVS